MDDSVNTEPVVPPSKCICSCAHAFIYAYILKDLIVYKMLFVQCMYAAI